MSFTAVGGDTQWLQPTQRCGPTDTHHQGPIGVKSPTDRQRVHILREKGFVGECVTDASIVKYLKDKRQDVRKGWSFGRTGKLLERVRQRGGKMEKKGHRALEDKQVRRATGPRKVRGREKRVRTSEGDRGEEVVTAERKK